MMAGRGIEVDHSTVHRWVIKVVPLFERTFRKHKLPVSAVSRTAVQLVRYISNPLHIAVA
jgi:transposase-like protein